MLYFSEAKQIWKSCVPAVGQASTVEGELLRAVEKLRDEAIRNGNGNWDVGFEILLSFIDGHLLDPKVFSGESMIDTAKIIAGLKDYENPCLDDSVYDALSDRVVEYFRYYGSMPHDRNPELLR